jgi:hypothetical protein
MSTMWQNVTVTTAGTFLFALIAAKVVPSQMHPATWADVLWSAGLQALAMGICALGYHTDVSQRWLGRTP